MPRSISGEVSSPRGTKTKSGCLTCKRIKCDEAKPHCARCTSTGRKCDGYGTSLQISDYRVRLSLSLPPVLKVSGSERENRCFQFFYERTVPSLAGYCGSEFWSRFVLQVSQHEKSVWHALIALGSLHENFENDQHIPGLWLSRYGQDNFALQEYVTAIRALLGPTGSRSPDSTDFTKLTVDVCLISCMLFACFEILSSHYDSAIKHIRSGIKIMNEVYCDPRSGAYCHPFLKSSTVTALEMDSLRKMLVRLQDQALTLTREEVDMQLSESVVLREIGLEIPEAFRSIGEARDTYEFYRCKAGRQFRALDSADPENFTDLIHHYSQVLKKLTMALDRFEDIRGPLLTARDKTGLKILRIYQKMQFILLEYGKLGVSDQKSWDNYNFMFEEIVTLAASVVDSAQGIECLSLSPSQLEELSRNGRLKPSFSLDMGIIAPVYNVATLCRDPVIRRKALAVLRSMSRQEGVFNSHACALVAEQAIAIEERMAAGMALNHQKERSLLMLLPGTRQSWQSETTEITQSNEIPDSARLTYIHPTIKIADKNVCLTIGQQGKHMDVPVPALTAMLDLVTL